MRTPLSLSKAQGAAQRLQWLVSRLSKSRLASGLSRESVEKFALHYWAVEGEQRCEAATEAVMAEEGQRASTDHTYHVVSNLAAKAEDGRFVALKASLTSVMGQSHVLGYQASQTACFPLTLHVQSLLQNVLWQQVLGVPDVCPFLTKPTTTRLCVLHKLDLSEPDI